MKLNFFLVIPFTINILSSEYNFTVLTDPNPPFFILLPGLKCLIIDVSYSSTGLDFSILIKDLYDYYSLTLIQIDFITSDELFFH